MGWRASVLMVSLAVRFAFGSLDCGSSLALPSPRG